MTLPPAWRGRWWTWALPLAFALFNLVVLIAHPGRTGAGFAVMEKEFESEARALAELDEKEQSAETVLAAARSSRAALAELYDVRFSTEAERLTRLITEVKRLAQLAGLEPSSISYPEQTLDEYDLVRMSLVFGIDGTYPQVRTLLNLLELSDLFLVLERVSLRDSAASSVLRISLQISTFFVREPEASSMATPARTGQARTGPPAERSSRPREGARDQDEAIDSTDRSPRS